MNKLETILYTLLFIIFIIELAEIFVSAKKEDNKRLPEGKEVITSYDSEGNIIRIDWRE